MKRLLIALLVLIGLASPAVSQENHRVFLPVAFTPTLCHGQFLEEISIVYNDEYSSTDLFGRVVVPEDVEVLILCSWAYRTTHPNIDVSAWDGEDAYRIDFYQSHHIAAFGPFYEGQVLTIAIEGGDESTALFGCEPPADPATARRDVQRTHVFEC